MEGSSTQETFSGSKVLEGSRATQVGHEFIILALRNLKQKDHQPGLKDCLIKSKKLPFIYL